MKLPEQNLLDALNSVEYVLFKHVNGIMESYFRLCNSQSLKEAADSLRDINLKAIDLEAQVKQILNAWGCPPAKILNVGARTYDTLDSKLLNMSHFYNRYAYSRPEGKAKELTAFYYLIKDALDISVETKPEHYYKDHLA